MARPERNNVDYFPFYCEDGKKMYYLEETYGNDGFATFIKILRELAKTNYHYLDLSNNATLMFLSAKCKISKEILKSIINDLVDLDKFDSVLWKENKIIWCQDFIDSIQDAYKKRNNKCITYEGLLTLLCSLGVRKLSKSTSSSSVNPQSKVKERKEKERKILLLFDSFWEKYHKITKLSKSDKEPSLKYWKKFDLEECNLAIDKIQDYYDSVNEKKYVKKARTYLRDKNFNDEFKSKPKFNYC